MKGGKSNMQRLSIFKILLNCLCIIMPSFVFADINKLYLQEGTAVLKGDTFENRTLCSSEQFKTKYVGYVCKGSETGISLEKTVSEKAVADKNYGITFCIDTRIPNEDRTNCDMATSDNSITHECEAGYLSWKGDYCIKCTDDVVQAALEALPDFKKTYGEDVTRYYCQPGTFKQIKRDDERVPKGIAECLPVNNQTKSVSNENHSGCVGDDMEGCPVGAKLNSDSICECMYGGTLSADKTKCVGMKIGKNDLKCGPNGCGVSVSSQCWSKTTNAEYKECMGF